MSVLLPIIGEEEEPRGRGDRRPLQQIKGGNLIEQALIFVLLIDGVPGCISEREGFAGLMEKVCEDTGHSEFMIPAFYLETLTLIPCFNITLICTKHLISSQQVRQLVYVGTRHDLCPLGEELLLLTYSRQHA